MVEAAVEALWKNWSMRSIKEHLYWKSHAPTSTTKWWSLKASVRRRNDGISHRPFRSTSSVTHPFQPIRTWARWKAKKSSSPAKTCLCWWGTSVLREINQCPRGWQLSTLGGTIRSTAPLLVVAPIILMTKKRDQQRRGGCQWPGGGGDGHNWISLWALWRWRREWWLRIHKLTFIPTIAWGIVIGSWSIL